MARGLLPYCAVLLALPCPPRAAAAEATGSLGGRVLSESAGGVGVQDAVVYALDVPPRSPGPRKAAISQRGRKLLPGVLPVAAGTVVEFPNFDPVFHNIYSLSEGYQFDLGLYPKGESRSVTFEKPGIVDVFCSIHPGMHAAILVLETDRFAVTDREGRFRLERLPAGLRRFAVWHERFGVREETAVVAGGRSARARVVLKASAGSARP